MGDHLNFGDLFKKSVLHLDAFRSVSYIDILLGLICSFGIGMFIYFVYKYTFRGVVYSFNYNVTFVLMSMITTLIIMTISTNIVLSLGMVGALSIVRFRTAVKDPPRHRVHVLGHIGGHSDRREAVSDRDHRVGGHRADALFSLQEENPDKSVFADHPLYGRGRRRGEKSTRQNAISFEIENGP